MPIACLVYRCSRQPEMYLYLRAGLDPSALPEALRQRTGRLVETLRLELTPGRRLARADAGHVCEALERQGWYLQLPPHGHVEAHLYSGD